MRYEEMLSYLKNNSIDDLSKELNIPYRVLYSFLIKRGFEPVIKKKNLEKRRSRINSFNIYGKTLLYNKSLKLSKKQIEIMIGTLFGDSGIYWSTKDRTAYFRCEHAWEQIGYCKAKIELLKPFSFSPFIDPPSKKIRLQDYQVGFSLHASEELAFYRELFYTQEIIGKSHLQKDIMQWKLWDMLTPISMAFWIMDDGKRNGSAFSISIGKQPYYTRARLEECVYKLNDKFCVDIKVYEDSRCYSIAVTKNSPVIEMVRDFILPHFYYKINLKPEDCGKYYYKFEWYQEWRQSIKCVEHPYIEQNPYSKSMYNRLKGNAKKRYFKAVLSQVRARGFPFVYLSDNIRNDLFKKLKLSSAYVEDNILIGHNRFNSIANSFMNHRYKLNVRGQKSPYANYLNRKVLKKILELQLKSGTQIGNGNIRAALSECHGQAVGQFCTQYAKYFCDNYCITGGRVLDPCAGFGSRLIGCLASEKNYTGIEPSIDTFKGLLNIASWMSKKIELKNECFEEVSIPKRHFDMAITSPPYFNKEEYSYDHTQSFIRYGNYELWKDRFLSALLHKVYISLKCNTVFILNIDDIDTRPLMKDSMVIAERVGFKIENILCSGKLKRPGSIFSPESYIILRKE